MILRKGKSARGRFFGLRVLPSYCSHPRFAIVSSKRVSKFAVDRNRARRRVREAIGLTLHEYENSCYDVVVLLSAACLEAEFESLKKEICLLMKTLGI